MGIKLNIVLFLGIVLILFIVFRIDLKDSTKKNILFTKELSFTDTTFTEVDTRKVQSSAFSEKGLRDQGVLLLKRLKYETKTLDTLAANYGTYDKDTMYVEGNVSFYEKEGFRYDTQYAVYDKKREVLKIPDSFSAIMNKNIIHGQRLRYNIKTKEVIAHKVNAVFYTSENR